VVLENLPDFSGLSGGQVCALTCSEQVLHLLAALVVVDVHFKAQALEALEELAGVSVGAVAYIHPFYPPGKNKQRERERG